MTKSKSDGPNHVVTAALLAGAAGATAGAAYWSAHAIARRNRASNDQPLNPVMKTAATACELAHGSSEKS